MKVTQGYLNVAVGKFYDSPQNMYLPEPISFVFTNIRGSNSVWDIIISRDPSTNIHNGYGIG
jgi:hypothetical protein